MIQSMTGYGKAMAITPNYKFSLEIRCLNSKQLDINLKVPGILRSLEPEIRSILSGDLYRGKIELVITEEKSEQGFSSINKDVVIRYYQELRNLAKELDDPVSGGFLPLVIRNPEVFSAPDKDLSEEDKDILKQAVKDAVVQVIDFRQHEGAILEKDFKLHIHNILELLSEVPAFEQTRIDRIKDRMKNNLEKIKGEIAYDPNRLEQEMIYYVEKLDITEEKIRLKKHCDYFLDILDKESRSGKKMGFVLQEIGREINTLGSKANDADLQQKVVLMKDELEKIKEQVLNIL